LNPQQKKRTGDEHVQKANQPERPISLDLEGKKQKSHKKTLERGRVKLMGLSTASSARRNGPKKGKKKVRPAEKRGVGKRRTGLLTSGKKCALKSCVSSK